MTHLFKSMLNACDLTNEQAAQYLSATLNRSITLKDIENIEAGRSSITPDIITTLSNRFQKIESAINSKNAQNFFLEFYSQSGNTHKIPETFKNDDISAVAREILRINARITID